MTGHVLDGLMALGYIIGALAVLGLLAHGLDPRRDQP